MKLQNLLVCLTVSLALSGKVGAAEGFDYLTHPAPPRLHDRINIAALGVVVDFTDTDEWVYLKKYPGTFDFKRDIDAANQRTALITIKPVFPPRTEFANLNEFFEFTRPDTERVRDKNGNDIEFSLSPSSKPAPLCVALTRKTRVVDPRRAGGAPLIAHVWEYICKHPTRAKVFVNLHYSELYAEKDSPTVGDVSSRAADAFARISFSE